MVKISKIFHRVSLFFLLVLISFLFHTNFANAASFKSNNDSFRIAEDQTIDDDLYISSKRVVIEGVVNGDVFVSSNDISIRGSINGDLHAIGDSMDVSGVIGNDLYFAGSSLAIHKGSIGDSVYFVGQSIESGKNSRIGGGLVAGSSTVKLNGFVGRGLTIASDDVFINGIVSNDSTVTSSNIKLGESALLKKDLNVYTNKKIDQDKKSSVLGKIKNSQVSDTQPSKLSLVISNILMAGYLFLASILVAVFVFFVARSSFDSLEDFKISSTTSALLWGTLVLITGIPVSLAFGLTVVGIPVGILVIILWLILIYISKIYGSFILISLLKSKQGDTESNTHPLYKIILGLALYYFGGVIPFVGPVLRLGITCLGLGSISLAFLNHVKNRKEKK
jgi:cytoskeletal protein CcmA (bactofilin family)